jgi:hypothetical protein
MLAGVFLPGLPPSEAQGVHRISMLTLIGRDNVDYLFSFPDWRGYEHECVQEMVNIQVSLGPDLKSEKVYALYGLWRRKTLSFD